MAGEWQNAVFANHSVYLVRFVLRGVESFLFRWRPKMLKLGENVAEPQWKNFPDKFAFAATLSRVWAFRFKVLNVLIKEKYIWIVHFLMTTCLDLKKNKKNTLIPFLQSSYGAKKTLFKKNTSSRKRGHFYFLRCQITFYNFFLEKSSIGSATAVHI